MGSRAGSLCIALIGVTTAVLLALMVFHRATMPLQAGDVFWQLRAGQMMLETGAIPDTETFSYTAYGAPWNNHEWLYEAALAVWHGLTGWLGVRLMVLVVIVASFVLFVWPWLCERRWSLGLLQATIAMILIAYKFIPAPQAVAMLMFFIGYRAFLRADLLTNKKRYVGLCAFMLLFGNLTAESLMFIPFVFADQFERVLNEPRRWLRMSIWLALPSALVMITPPESSILEYFLMRGQGVNAEFARLWEPALVVTRFSRNLGWAIVVAYLFFVAACTWRTRSVPEGAAVGLLAVAGAVLFQRNLFLLILPVEQLLRAWPERRFGPRRVASTIAVAVLFAAFAINVHWNPIGAAGVVRAEYWSTPIDASSNPVACLDPLRSLPSGSRVFTKHLWASYVILHAPQLRIFVDGRNREYPEAVHRAAFQIERGGPEALRLLRESNTEWVLADPDWLGRVPAGSWQLQGYGRTCALFSRIGGSAFR